MRLGRFTACVLSLAGVLALATCVHAADAPAPATTAHPSGAKKKPSKPQQDSAAARAEREKQEDLERRVEQLEQRYEMQQPDMPATDAGRPKAAP